MPRLQLLPRPQAALSAPIFSTFSITPLFAVESVDAADDAIEFSADTGWRRDAIIFGARVRRGVDSQCRRGSRRMMISRDTHSSARRVQLFRPASPAPSGFHNTRQMMFSISPQWAIFRFTSADADISVRPPSTTTPHASRLRSGHLSD